MNMTPEDWAIHQRNARRAGPMYWNYWIKRFPMHHHVFDIGKKRMMVRP